MRLACPTGKPGKEGQTETRKILFPESFSGLWKLQYQLPGTGTGTNTV